MDHEFDATRTSPFGYYATCSCGWCSPHYTDSHESAWHTWQDHFNDTYDGAPRYRPGMGPDDPVRCDND